LRRDLLLPEVFRKSDISNNSKFILIWYTEFTYHIYPHYLVRKFNAFTFFIPKALLSASNVFTIKD